ncbi:MAG: type I-E CRISPR-associated endonuclease Cas1 [Planctomycetia bacterium]|nr:type I-E CRISPR-associated endonuclease Cas1 [Planctomycetia bacterium]
MRDLQTLPRFDDRWSHVYLEHGSLEVEATSLAFWDKEGQTKIPIDQLALLMMGPGTKITHGAMKALADNNCLVCWTGEQGVRLYAHSTGGTFSSHRLLRQAELYANPAARRAVVRRMYQKRFPAILPVTTPIEAIRGMEGARVRAAYKQLAERHGVVWQGRDYDQDNWNSADPLNRALSSANACLYGLCHSAILSAGYSAAIGFVHVGKMLSFVYDIADLYKTDTTIPVAFETVAASGEDVERRVRLSCRDVFHQTKLIERILPDIAEVLDARDDLEERPGEREGRAVSLASGTGGGSVPRQPDRPDPGRPVADGEEQGGTEGERGPDLELPEPPGVSDPGS